MGKPSTTLESLVKTIGPINTFYIGPKGAAYTQLKIITTRPRFRETYVEQPTPKWQGGKPTKQVRLVKEIPGKEIITNYIIPGTEIPPIEGSARAEAVRAARNQGRIECSFIGRPQEIPAAMMIINIAANAKLRSLHRKAIKKAVNSIKQYWLKKKFSLPNPKQPDTLGWRIWHWDSKARLLKSPSLGTLWHNAELRVPKWDTGNVVRGRAGIHAARMPYDWRKASLDETELNGYALADNAIVGVVERLGRYVLGTEGWRTEWAIIRALKAPSTEIGLALEQAYPDVPVYYD